MSNKNRKERRGISVDRYPPGQSVAAKGTYAGVVYHYRVYVPAAYDPATPLPLILQHPGWGLSAPRRGRGAAGVRPQPSSGVGCGCSASLARAGVLQAAFVGFGW